MLIFIKKKQYTEMQFNVGIKYLKKLYEGDLKLINGKTNKKLKKITIKNRNQLKLFLFKVKN